MTGYMNLESWKESMQLVKQVYGIVKGFPKEELFVITAQIKRAAISVPANIAEGNGRQTRKDSIHFLHIARGSLYELETLMVLGMMIGYITEVHFKEVQMAISKVQKLLNGLIRYYENASLK